jgi:hypothetical protein
MLSTLRTVRTPSRRFATQLRTAATQSQKRAGDISDAFASLSGQEFKPLTPEYADLKGRLIKGRENEVRESWERLLRELREEIPLIVELGSKVIPEINFKDIDNAPETFNSELRKRGVAVVRDVVPENEALQWKEDLREYIRQNPQTKGRNVHYNAEIQTNHVQHFLPITLKSSSCTGRALSSSRVGIRTCSRHNAS